MREKRKKFNVVVRVQVEAGSVEEAVRASFDELTSGRAPWDCLVVESDGSGNHLPLYALEHVMAGWAWGDGDIWLESTEEHNKRFPCLRDQGK